MDKGVWFLLGAGTGAFLTWLFLKNKYSVYEIKEEYEPSFQNETKEEKKEAKKEFSVPEKPPLVNYANKIYANEYVPEKPSIESSANKIYANDKTVIRGSDIYVIPPEEFREIDDYDNYTLTYYAADGVLADENDEIVDDVEGAVGLDFADHFGEYEEDSVYVRNDIRSCDYEILWDTRSYDEVLKTKPKPVEVK